MRLLSVLLLAAALPASAATRPKHPAHATRPVPASSAPRTIGTWERWSAATHSEDGQLVCYAFTRAAPGGGEAVLTVTERRGSRDAVAISAGHAYPKDATVEVQVGSAMLPFYAAGSSAFARDGKAAVAAFRRGHEVVARAPSPKMQVVDTFGLQGFSASYAAILKECSAK